MNNLKTRWFDEAFCERPLPEYPRPQFVRKNWLCLNGFYDYKITDINEKAPDCYEGKILVPFSIESQLSGVCKPLRSDQLLWYRRRFTLDGSFKNKRTILHFGAVDWKCSVFINGAKVGQHTGGYCPFSFDITEFLIEGENELTLSVFDPTDDGWQQRGKQVLKSKGFWYTATSGIWQTVWLEPVCKTHIKCVKLTPCIENSSIQIAAEILNDEGYELRATIYDENIEIYSGMIPKNAEIKIDSPKLWSPESPKLYDIKFELAKAGEIADTVRSYFGMRSFGIGKDSNGIPRLLLNGKPYFQKGLLDQGYWCDGVLTPPTDEAMIYDIAKMKELGFNMLRKHIKTEPLRWYYHCDRLGMIVWQDMISGGKYIGNLMAGVLPFFKIQIKDSNYSRFSRDKKEWRENFRSELFEMIDSLYNCVSIGCWVPFNEGWGQFDAKQIGDEVKALDPGRVVDHASGWYDQKGKDLISIHEYILPVRMPKADERPFVLSEFGGYSMILDNHVWNRQKSFGYIMFKNSDTLTRGYKKLMEKQVIPLISRGLSATVYTQVSDVEFEVNGILSYDRKVVKIDEETIKKINTKLVL